MTHGYVDACITASHAHSLFGCETGIGSNSSVATGLSQPLIPFSNQWLLQLNLALTNVLHFGK